MKDFCKFDKYRKDIEVIVKQIDENLAEVPNRIAYDDDEFKKWIDAKKETKKLHELFLENAKMVDCWKENYEKLFVVDQKLIEDFKETDIPEGIKIGDISLPFDCFMIEGQEFILSDAPVITKTTALEKGFVLTKYFGTSLIVCRGFIHNQFMKNKTIQVFDNSGSLTSIVPNDEVTLTFIKKFKFKMGEEVEEREGFEVKCLLAKNLDLELVRSGGNFVKDDMEKFFHMIVNILLYIDGETEYHEERTDSAMADPRKKGKHRFKERQFIYLRHPAKHSIVSQNIHKGHVLDKRMLVRGHWKMQAYGEKHSLRKYKRVEPYWRGPELAEIINRKYKVNEQN